MTVEQWFAGSDGCILDLKCRDERVFFIGAWFGYIGMGD